MKRLSICICGGGGLGHVIAGYVGAKQNFEINILTGKPALWGEEVLVEDTNHRVFQGKITRSSDDPQDVIPQSDIILLCVPGYLIKETLIKIKPYITDNQYIGTVVSSTGFFFMAREVLPSHIKLFGFQRVPFIARVNEYGQSAYLLGYKKQLKVATLNIENSTSLISLLTEMFDTPITPLLHFLEASLSNSNPLLHTARLYALFRDYKKNKGYPEHYYFYATWTDETSDLLIKCDNEFQILLDGLPVNKKEIPSLLEYYESNNAIDLTKKIRSIEAFKEILAPMVKLDDTCYVPDFESRYFTEDFPYGLSLLKSIAHIQQLQTPYIDTVLKWGYEILGNEIFLNAKLDEEIIKDMLKRNF